MTASRAFRKPAESALATLCLIFGFVFGVGCGSSPPAATTSTPGTASTSSAATPVASTSSTALVVQSTASSAPEGATTSTSVTTPTSAPQHEDLAALFARLAESAAPMTVFAPTSLPEAATLAEHWLPVIESEDPGTDDGPPMSNPQVLGSGAESEIQVVFRTGEGWLAILENFRGDLGDVSGTPVGLVAGHPAELYVVNGGELIQWSEAGLWYGVFGRGIDREQLIATALGMQPVPPRAS